MNAGGGGAGEIPLWTVSASTSPDTKMLALICAALSFCEEGLVLAEVTAATKDSGVFWSHSSAGRHLHTSTKPAFICSRAYVQS